MRKGTPWIGALIIMVFLAGIIAPVPECYVFKVACPAKSSFAAEISSCGKGGSCPASKTSACCSPANSADGSQKKCSLTGFKPRIKSYLPDIETAAAPAVPLALLPSLFHTPFTLRNIARPFVVELCSYSPEPIPILLRKQSFLI